MKQKAFKKSVRKALRRHSIAVGVTTGVATAIALSSTGAARNLSDVLGRGIGKLLRFRPTGVWDGVRHAAGGALTRAGSRLTQDNGHHHEPRGIA